MKQMRRIATLFWVVLCVLVVGCGGGATSTQAVPITPTPVVVAPTITAQPLSQTVDEGTTVVFSVAAVGDAPLHYQWQRNGVDVAGATQAQYSFVAQFKDSGSVWKVKVSNASATFALSQEVGLTVVPNGIALLAGTLTDSSGPQTYKYYQDGKGADARFFAPSGLAVDSMGTVYVADYNAVRKLTADGTVTTFAGVHGETGTANGDGPAARFGVLGGIAMGMDGNLYVVDTPPVIAGRYTAETQVGAIRKISPQGGVTTLATWSFDVASNDPWNGSLGRNPVIDRAGNVYVLVALSQDFFTAKWRVLKVSPNGVVTSFGPSTIGSTGFAQGDIGKEFLTTLGLDGQSNLLVSMSSRYGCTQQTALDAFGEVTTSPLLKSCVRGLTTNASGASFAMVPLTDETGQRSGYGLAKLSKMGDLAVFAGSLNDLKAGWPTPTLGDLPGNLGRVHAIAADSMGFIYTLSDNAVLRVRVP